MDIFKTDGDTFVGLTERERFYGICPSELKKLNFPEAKECKKMVAIFRQFFCGCRLAADKEEFKDACQALLYKQKIPGVVVKAINFALLADLPTYKMIDMVTSSLFFKKYVKKREFVYLNNFIISSNRGHLLHPSRSVELTAIVKEKRLAILLSRYHFLGKEGVEIRNLQERSLHLQEEAKSSLNEKIDVLKKLFYKKKETLGFFPNDFKPGDFSFHIDPFYNNILTKAYTYLDSKKAWSYLDTNEETLFLTDFLFLEPFQVLLAMVGGDKHQLGVVLDWLLKVKKTPWREVVKGYQDELEESVGMMTRVKRYVPLSQ